MIIHILSLFPESMKGYLESSMMKRAQEKGLFQYMIHNLTDWTVRNTRRVDDRPYGGGAGTIITVEPLTLALRSLKKEYGDMKIIFLSPRGDTLDQQMSQEFADSSENYIIICGHYEGIDARIFDLFDIREISIGDYVLSSGELAALVWIDSVVRLIPGVLSEDSLREESFAPSLEGKKEYPQYSRPETFEHLTVPPVLLCGDQKKIQKWNMEHRKS